MGHMTRKGFLMRNGIENIGAPDSTVINEEFTLLCVTLLQQADETPGSEMLLNVKVSIGGLAHIFLVGGYWSTDGFRMTAMLTVGRIPPHEGSSMHNTKPNLYGLAFTSPSAVQQDRVQQAINSQEVGKPAAPQPALKRRRNADELFPGSESED